MVEHSHVSGSQAGYTVFKVLHGRLTAIRTRSDTVLLNLGPVLLNLVPSLLNSGPVLLRIDLRYGPPTTRMSYAPGTQNVPSFKE